MRGMTQEQDIIARIEDAAAQLGVAPSTVGERAGQGGRFYSRLTNGARVWPETAERVKARIDAMLTKEAAK